MQDRVAQLAIQCKGTQALLRAGVAVLQNGVAVNKYSKRPMQYTCSVCGTDLTVHKVKFGAKYCSPACSLKSKTSG